MNPGDLVRVGSDDVGIVVAVNHANSTGGTDHWYRVMSNAPKTYYVLCAGGILGPLFGTELEST
jgi:hypothetical protein